MTAEREVENLHEYIKALRVTHQRELADERARTAAQMFRAETAEWAVRGIVNYDVHITIDPLMLSHLKDTTGLVRAIGEHAGLQLLHSAKLAFTQQANYHALLHHLHYLESHARGRGLEFAPFEAPDPEGIPREWYWPKPKAAA